MNKIVFGISSVTLYLISLLPFWLVYLFADLLFVVLYYLVHYRRDVVSANLANAFPEKTDRERKNIGRKYYRHLADMILESVKMLSISRRSIKKRFRLNNVDEISRYFTEGRSVLVATGHYANWEWGTLIITSTIKENVIVIYKPLSDKRFEALINRMRSRFGAVMVAMKQTLRKIAEYRSQLTLSVFVSDQTPAYDDSYYFTRFLNQPTAVFLGIEKISKLTDKPVLFCHINKYKRGFYEATFKTLAANPAGTAEHEITEAHTHELETIIRQRPELWLWSHRRWKFKPEDART